ncbi:DUF3306 domain-containing protein [Polynucleobacter sp. AP-Nino-20-G2]|uniref:DUF3306 domain-containing protein n=1 Tax=Polynucleobacter sp. AP-Nino-20-G2 TaxID=2576917 RepID=UPI001BFDB14D|nr:DUF3306 domain-containing protein [Polynucleobacter sp. AP-Nino-20-G2]QWE15949.1 DUF3306 domain-containing protein [Polynucleobacter sp. AP-Nino-20-G2]
MAGGFLNRWSRRKAGEQIEPELGSANTVVQKTDAPSADLNASTEPGEAPPLTLADVEKIDRFAPDFSAFMQPGVDPAVQQAAMKKMFSDPHFNVMDGLDIYIDDYSKPDPIPLEMLKRMVQSDMLNIFRKGNGDEDEKTGDAYHAQVAEATNPPLAVSDQSDLTSTPLASNQEVEDQQSIPVDKKTS